MARHNLIDTRYRQMAFQLLDGPVVESCLGFSGQTKVRGNHMKFVVYKLKSYANNVVQ